MSNKDILTVRRLRKNGYSIGLIASRVNLPITTIKYHIEDIKVKAKYQLQGPNKYLFLPKEKIKPFRPSNSLAYLLGLYLGDGYVGGMTFQISCGTKFHTYLLEKWKNVIERVCRRKISIVKIKKSKCVALRIYDKWIAYKLGVKEGSKTYTCRIPSWIFSQELYMKKCLLGLMETDGGVYYVYKKGYWNWWATFTSASPNLISGVIKICGKLKIPIAKSSNSRIVRFGQDGTDKLIRMIDLDKCIKYVYNKK